MGWDATSFLAASARRADVAKCLVALGFVRVRVTDAHFRGVSMFWYFSEKDYASLSGIRATVRKVGNRLEVHTHAWMDRSQGDCDVHNLTLRRLRERFEGHFESDEGRNRYFRFRGIRRTPCESGCYLAYRRLEGNLNHAEAYLFLRQFNVAGPREAFQYHPAVLSNALVRVFLVTILEDYLKSTYVALLRYSNRKKVALESAGRMLRAEDLVAISDGRLLEPIVADRLGFSNLSKACDHFKALDPKLDLAGVLRKPFRRRKTNLFDSINTTIGARNEFIHGSIVDPGYDDEQLAADFAGIVAATDRIYSAIVAHHPGWTLELAPRRRRVLPSVGERS